MRVLHILNHTLKLAGHVHAVVDLACTQSNTVHEVAVASSGGDFDNLFRENNVAPFCFDFRRRPFTLIRTLVRLGRFVYSWRPDVIHVHMMTSAVIVWPICKLLRVPLVTTVHNEFQRSSILMGLGDRVIAVSGAVAQSLYRRGISKSRIDIVLNGTIGSARSNRRTSVPIQLAGPSILFVGGLHPRKGLPFLLQAFEKVHQEFPAASLHIVGDGPFLKKYKNLAESLASYSSVSFEGPKLDPYPWMLGADIFVLPSLSDPAPLVISEAREAACAIVASNVDGIPELLEYGKAGILVSPASSEELAQALLTLISCKQTLVSWKNNSQFNIEKMSIFRVSDEVTEVYRRAIS